MNIEQTWTCLSFHCAKIERKLLWRSIDEPNFLRCCRQKKIRNNSYNFLCCGPHSYYVMEMTEKIGAKEKISQMGLAIVSGFCCYKKSVFLRTMSKVCLISFMRKWLFHKMEIFDARLISGECCFFTDTYVCIRV